MASAGRASSPTARETELKLAVTPRTFERLRRDPVLGAPAGPAAPLESLYFDTADHALWRSGMALRLRREGGHWIQTIKGQGAVVAGVHQRAEFNRRARRGWPDPRLLGDSEIERRVAAVTEPLVPVFRVVVEREQRLLVPAPGVLIEVSFDRGRIEAGRARAAVCEIELELKEGPVASLYELALAVLARAPARIEPRSKAGRGYQLAGVGQPAPVRIRRDVVRSGMTTSEAFRASAVACLDHLYANQPGVLAGGQAEYLHQVRVALRRLRSLLDVFRPPAAKSAVRPHRQALRRITRALGPARDLDVFVAHTLAPMLEQFPGHRGLAAFERAAGRLCADANRRARRILGNRRSQADLLRLADWLAGQAWLEDGSPADTRAWAAPAREHATAVLERCHRRVLKRGRGIGSAGPARLHRLRIALKQLRYAAGFFAPLFLRVRVAPMREALNGLQELLGSINDHATATELIAVVGRRARGSLQPQARLILEHWNEALLAEQRRALKPAWKTLRACAPFWCRARTMQ